MPQNASRHWQVLCGQNWSGSWQMSQWRWPGLWCLTVMWVGALTWEPLPQKQCCTWTPPGSDLAPPAAGTTSPHAVLAQMPTSSRGRSLWVYKAPARASLLPLSPIPQSSCPVEPCCVTLLRSHLQCCVRFWAPGLGPVESYKND